MTREIKFRGKDIHGEWHYGYLFRGYDGLESYSLILDGKIFDCDNDMPDKYSVCFCENEVAVVRSDTIGQYTGLTDKNGKEIYEGDILASEGKVIGWVQGGVRGYCYDVIYIDHPQWEKRWSLYGTVVNDYPGKLEVIGNIYDNRELLEK